MKHGRAAPGTGWTIDEVEYLRQHWFPFQPGGMSARAIGAVIGRTRSAVIGMANRLNLPIESTPPEIERPRPKPPPPRPKIEGTTCDVPDCRNTRQPGRDKCAEHLPRRPRTAGSRPIVDTGAAT